MGQSRCLREVDHALKKFSNPRQHRSDNNGYGSGNHGLLKLHFLNCQITEQDVTAMAKRMEQEFFVSGIPPLHVAFPCTKLEGPSALRAMESFASNHKIQSLSFSVANLSQEEMRRIVAASKHSLQTLHLTMRYKESVQPLIQELCLPDKPMGKDEEQKEESLLAPIQELKLDARQPMESRIRIPRMQELAEALPGLQNRLQSFELTSCDFDDEAFAILVGGLLQLRSSLEWVHLQNVRGDISPRSLIFVSYLMTELPRLSWLHLEVKNSKRKLFANATEQQVNGLMTALQQCTSALRLELSNVGMNQRIASELLQTATTTLSPNLSLLLEDSSFVKDSDLFVKTLVEHLPNMRKCTELSLVDTCSSWSSRNDQLIVDALERNRVLERMELRVGEWDWNERHREKVPAILQRNVDARLEPGSSCCVSDGLWPDALADDISQPSTTRCSSSPSLPAEKGRAMNWLTACNPLKSRTIADEGDDQKLPSGRQNDLVAKKENEDEEIRRPTPVRRRVSEDSLLRQQRLEDALNNFGSSSSSSESSDGWDTSTYSGSDISEDFDNDSLFSSAADLPGLVPYEQTETEGSKGANIKQNNLENDTTSKDVASVPEKKKRKKSSKTKKKETYAEREERKSKEKKHKKKRKSTKKDDENNPDTEAGKTEEKKKKKSKKKNKTKKKTKSRSVLAQILEEEAENGAEPAEKSIEVELMALIAQKKTKATSSSAQSVPSEEKPKSASPALDDRASLSSRTRKAKSKKSKTPDPSATVKVKDNVPKGEKEGSSRSKRSVSSKAKEKQQKDSKAKDKKSSKSKKKEGDGQTRTPTGEKKSDSGDTSHNTETKSAKGGEQNGDVVGAKSARVKSKETKTRVAKQSRSQLVGCDTKNNGTPVVVPA